MSAMTAPLRQRLHGTGALMCGLHWLRFSSAHHEVDLVRRGYFVMH